MKEDLEYCFVCPKCKRQDLLDWGAFCKYVLSDRSSKFLRSSSSPETHMEGQYPCPHGCRVPMGIFAIGTPKEVQEKAYRLYMKYKPVVF